MGFGGSMVARQKLKGIDGRAHQEWSVRLNLTQHGETYQGQIAWGLTDWELFHDMVGGGAWSFLVGGVNCLVNSDNERDLGLLCRFVWWQLCFFFFWFSLWLFSDRHRGQKRGQGRMTWDFVEGHLIVKELKEGRGNNRSVMPLDALGRTRATMLYSECEWFCCLWLMCVKSVLVVDDKARNRHWEMEGSKGKDSKVGIDDWNCLSWTRNS